jgi:iron complex outermembrane receptor protein
MKIALHPRAAGVCLSCALLTVPSVRAADTDESASAPAQTVVVTASPITEQDKLATLVESVSRDEILRSGGANLADALAHTPGVSGTSFAAGASRPVIRGFDANRVRILESGIGSFDVSELGPDHGIPIDPLSAQRIEVVRGAATLRYGSQAIGGVVNAINDRVPTRLPEKAASGEVSALYGTNADTRQGAALLDARLGQFALHADGYTREMADYETPGGVLGNSFWDGDGYSLGGSYFFGENRIGGALIHYDANYGIPGEDAYIDMRQTKQLMRSSFDLGAGIFRTLTIDGGYADYEHSEREEDGTAAATFKDREWEGRAEALLGAAGPFSASALGVQVQRRDFSALGEAEDYLRPATTKSAAIFFFGDAPIGDRVHLHTGARIEDAKIDGTPASDIATSQSFTPISASLGLLYDATETVRLGATLSSAARAPAQTELYARGPHEGTATFESGNPALDLERANSLEATLRAGAGRVRFEGALWGARFSDYIFGQLTGRSCDEEGACSPGAEELQELLYVQDDARFWGAEAKAVVDVMNQASGSLQATALADYVRAKLDDGSNVPRITPWHVGAGLNWEGANADAGVMLKYSGRQSDVGFAETPTAGFLSVDAQAAWRPFASNPGIELAVIGRNLTDTIQRNALALNKDEVILPGREIRFMVRAVL